MTNKNTIIAFDLDGTLLDSADDLIDTLNILLKEMNINEMKFRSFVVPSKITEERGESKEFYQKYEEIIDSIADLSRN